MSLLRTLQAPGKPQLPRDSLFKAAGSQKGCTFVVLPSVFRFRAGQSREDGVRVYVFTRQGKGNERQLSCPGLWELGGQSAFRWSRSHRFLGLRAGLRRDRGAA